MATATFTPGPIVIELGEGTLPDGTDLTPLIQELTNTTAALTAVLEQLTQVVGALQAIPNGLTSLQTALDGIEVHMTPMSQDVLSIREAVDQITGRPTE